MRGNAFEESDIKAGVRDGGRLLGVFLVGRPVNGGTGYVAYIRTNWARGFRPLRTFRGKSDRVYRDLDRLVALLREDFRFRGEISLFVAGDESLARFRALLPAERDALAVKPDGDGAGDASGGEPPSSEPPSSEPPSSEPPSSA